MEVMINFGKNELKVYIIEWFSIWSNMKKKQTERFLGEVSYLMLGKDNWENGENISRKE